MRTSDSAVGVAAAARPWAAMTAQTTSSYGGCDPVQDGSGLGRPRPQPACLFLTHTQTLPGVSNQGLTCAYLGSSHFCRSIPDGTPAGRRAKAFPDPLAAPVLPVEREAGGEQEGCPGPLSLELLPKTRPGLGPTGLGRAMCNMWRVFWGAVGGLGDGILSHVQYLCFFLDVYLPKHLFMQ